MGQAAQDGHCQRGFTAFIKIDRVLMTAFDDHDVAHEGKNIYSTWRHK